MSVVSELVALANRLGVSVADLRYRDLSGSGLSERRVRAAGGFAAVKRQAEAGTHVPVPPPDLLDRHRARAGESATRRELKEALDRLAAAEDRLAVALDLASAQRTATPIARREASKREGTAVVLCSDWHVEERVDAIKVNGRNVYTPEIARERVERLGRGIVALIESHRSLMAIDNLVLWLGGDLITGYIHEELLESNFLSPTRATMFAHDLIADLIRYVLEHGKLERLIVPCSYGNHGRLTPKPRISTGADNSLEYFMYHNIRREFAADHRVEFVIAEGECTYVQVYDTTLRFTHGDAIKFGGGVGGVHIPLRKAIAGWDTDIRADVTCLGHFHQYIPHPRYVVNGSLIGWSPYGVRIKADYEHARQAFFVVDSREGPCLHTPIWCQKRAEAGTVRRF